MGSTTSAHTPLQRERAAAHEGFLAAHPEYAGTAALDALRRREFARLDAGGHVYLDYTGSGLYAASQVQQHAHNLLAEVYGNPHSVNPTSLASSRLVETCRARVLQFFGADPREYVAIFTANASHALKLVGESYPFAPGDQFLLTFDNHNSVNGIREYDRAHGARTVYVPMLPPSLRVDEVVLARHLDGAERGRHNLFAYPAQSNFSGVHHPLEWIERAHSCGWDVLLDAAAFVPTNRLDLGRHKPDFVALSFYKMFGYPTGVGALIARHDAIAKLHRPWFAGGTIHVASVQADRFVRADGAPAFEDGTLDFINIPAVMLGLDLLESVGLDAIHTRVRALTAWLLETLPGLLHANGLPLVRLYGPTDTESRGGAIAFNLYDAAGNHIDQRRIEEHAAAHRISLRTGCFCNPGAGETALGLTRPEIDHCLGDSDTHMTYDDLRSCIDPKAAGAVRISLGLASNFDDAFTFVTWLRSFLERGTP